MTAFVAGSATAQTAPPAQAGDGTGDPTAYAVRPADGAIRVDGALTDPGWRDAVRIPLDWEVAPGENERAPVRTECRVAYDTEALLIGCSAYDADPDAIRAYITDRDGIDGHDRVVIALDTYGDSRRAFRFGVSALGVQSDAIFSQQSTGGPNGGGRGASVDRSWDAIWESAGRITGDGYVVEAAIPFESLRYPASEGPQRWGLLISRFWPRGTATELRSAPIDRSDSCALCQANRLEGLRAPEPSRAPQLVPTVTATRVDTRDGQGTEATWTNGSVEPEVGADATWSPASDLTVNLTVNPDFSQVEADAARLDANTAFALFFPEKRPFFLESVDFYATPMQVLFTRTIADPIAGAKVSGKLGGTALGALVAMDERPSVLVPGNQGSFVRGIDGRATTGVMRVRRDVGESSTVGVAYVGREGERYHNRTFGVDGFFQPIPEVTARLHYARSHTRYPDAFADETDQPREAFQGDGFQGSLQLATRDWIVSANGLVRSPTFRADAGFVPQVDTRGGNLSVTRRFWGGRDRWFSRLAFQVGRWHNEAFDGDLLNGGLWLGLRYAGPAQTFVGVYPNIFRERFRGVEYDRVQYYFSAGARPTGRIGLTLNGTAGDAIDRVNGRAATELRVSPTLELRVGRGLDLSLAYSFQHLATDVGGDRIVGADVLDLRAVYNFSTRAFVRAIVQGRSTDRDPALYETSVDAEDRSLSGQFLFSYKLNPRTVLLLGLSEQRADAIGPDPGASSLVPMRRTFFAKVGYAWRP